MLGLPISFTYVYREKIVSRSENTHAHTDGKTNKRVIWISGHKDGQ